MKQVKKFLTEKYLYIRSKAEELINIINSNDSNRLAALIIVSFSTVTMSYFYYDHKVTVAKYNLEATNKQLEIVKAKNLHEEEIEKIRAETKKEVAAYNVRAEEARASMNPYIAAAHHGRSTPINVFIDTHNNNYVIGTTDAETEISISTITVKGRKYTPEQRKLMEMAFHIGKEVGFPETIQSLLLQETQAGAYGDRIGDINLPIGKRSYGVMQIKVATARKVLKKYPNLVKKYFPVRKKLKRVRDEEIIIKLIQDDEFNIRLAALNFLMHRKASKSWAQAVVAYNTGQGKSNKIREHKKHEYYLKVLNKLVKDVRPFNEKANLKP